MKRISILFVILLTFGMAVFAQSLASFTTEYYLPEASFGDRLDVLEDMIEAGVKGDGEWYHKALIHLLEKSPEIFGENEQAAAEKSVVILSQALGEAKYTEAAQDLWLAAETFDVVYEANEGIAMQSAIIAIGQVNGTNMLPQILRRINDHNTQTYRNPEARRRVQVTVIGCIKALELFKDMQGYAPVFFASVGSYDPMVKQMAQAALPNIVDDPGEVVIEIIRDPSVTPPIKLVAWNEFLKSNAPAASRAKVASAALDVGWIEKPTSKPFQTNLSDMRKGAIAIIRQNGAADDSVYTNLYKSYNENYKNRNPDFDEIIATFNALIAIKNENAVKILYNILNDLHGRRLANVWGQKERQIFEWVTTAIGATGTSSQEVKDLLYTIQRSGGASKYTSAEQIMARNALQACGG